MSTRVKQEETAPVWLVTLRGNTSTLSGAWLRPDALNRIARASLEQGSPIFMLFEDRVLIYLEPAAFGTWQTQGDLVERLVRLVAGEDVPGAKLWPRQRLEKHMETVLNFGQGVQQILQFKENGSFLLGSKSMASTNQASSHSLRTLCVIGGVRDVKDDEQSALEKEAAKANLEIKAVSFGCKPHLTSKVMKAFAVMRNHWRSTAIASDFGGQQCPEHADQSHEAVVHFVYRVTKHAKLKDFIQEPAALRLFIDTFKVSHGLSERSRLTIMDEDNEVLSFEQPRNGARFLEEIPGLQYLQQQYQARKTRASLDKVLGFPVNGMLRSSRMCVVHADEAASPLPCEGVPAAGPSESRAVVVVIAPAAEASMIQAAARSAFAYTAARASLGSPDAVVAYATMLNHEGLLAPAVSEAARKKPEAAMVSSCLTRSTKKTAQAKCMGSYQERAASGNAGLAFYTAEQHTGSQRLQ